MRWRSGERTPKRVSKCDNCELRPPIKVFDLVVVPFSLAVLCIYLLSLGKILIPPRMLALVFIIPGLLALLLMVLITFIPRLTIKFGQSELRPVAGALVGGILAASLVGYFGYKENTNIEKLSVSLAENKIEKLALLSLENRYVKGYFLQANIIKSPILLKTESLSTDAAAYRADFKSIPGKFVASLFPGTGHLYWIKSKKDKNLLSCFTLGTVQEGPRNKLVIRNDKGETLTFILAEDIFGVKYSPGALVVVAFDPKTFITKNIEEITLTTYSELTQSKDK